LYVSEKNYKLSYGERGKIFKTTSRAAIENFLLKINECGLATCWVGHFYDEKIKRILKIPSEIEIEAIFPIGYPFEKPKNKRKIELDEILYFNEYKNKKMITKKKLDV
jgi:nitroreductase